MNPLDKQNPLHQKRVLVTGGTGSLAKALLSRAKREKWETEFIIFSRDETKQTILKEKYPEHQFVLGDVARYLDLKRALRGVDTVLHFAAYKQIPSAQNNISATIQTNILGSQNVVDAAIDQGVNQVVASSTDKAMSPENFYGVSKKAMEYIFQDANKYNATTFHLARYGNVLLSNMSVGILWKAQAKRGEPITITDERMSRFFLSLDQAIDLILLALQKEPGIIVVPRAPSMMMIDLAKVIGGDLPVIVSGIRAGEKLAEGMISESESFYVEQDEEHFYIHPPTSDYRNSDAPFSYMSDNSIGFLSHQEIKNMIEETERLYGI